MTMERFQYQEQSVNPEISLPFFRKHYVIVGGTSGIGLESAKAGILCSKQTSTKDLLSSFQFSLSKSAAINCDVLSVNSGYMPMVCIPIK